MPQCFFLSVFSWEIRFQTTNGHDLDDLDGHAEWTKSVVGRADVRATSLVPSPIYCGLLHVFVAKGGRKEVRMASQRSFPT